MPSDDYLKKDLLEEWSSTPYIAGKERARREKSEKKKPVVPQEKPKKEKKK